MRALWRLLTAVRKWIYPDAVVVEKITSSQIVELPDETIKNRITPGELLDSLPRELLSQEPVVQPESKPRPGRPRGKIAPERLTELRKFAKLRRAYADNASKLITKLISLTKNDDTSSERDNERLGHLLGCDFYLYDRNIADDNITFINPKDNDVKELAEMFWPVDNAVAVPEDGYLFLHHIYTVTPEEVRGKVKLVVPKMVHCIYGEIYDSGKWWISSAYYGLVNGKWRDLHRGQIKTVTASMYNTREIVSTDDRYLHDSIEHTMAMHFSGLLTQRYQWHVALGLANGPRILLPTSPGGCRELFKNRDAVGSRREALRHWVSRHLRESGDATITFVRQHLRGATSFRWSDLDGEIMVSAHDLEKNEEFRNEAEKWRSQRKHNYFRVRLKKKSA